MADAFWGVAVAVLLATAAARLSGVHVNVRRATAAGGTGVVTFGLVAAALDNDSMGLAGLGLMAICGLLAAMVTVAGAEMLTRPRPGGSRTPTTPLFAVRARVARLRRYGQVIGIVARNGLTAGRRDRRASRQLGPALCDSLQEAGGVFVKLGQLLSTRPDLVSPDVAGHLGRLQEDVSRMPYADVKQVVVEDLGASPTRLFAEFDHRPAAAGSLAQVHQAVLTGGQRVAVKVQRPGIDDQVRRDLDILGRFARRLERSAAWARDMRLIETVHGLAAAMHEELDFSIEARNGTDLGVAIAHHSRIRVPAVHRRLSSRRVLVTDWIDGRSVSAITSSDLDPTDRNKLASELLRCMLEQLLMIGTFHADPHPGNVYLTAERNLALLDFGSVGRLTRRQAAALLSMLVAIDQRDPTGLREALEEIAIPSAPVDGMLLERALAQLVAQQLHRIDAGLFVAVMAIVRDFRLAVDPMVAGAFRAIATLEGTLGVLADDFDIVESSRRQSEEILMRAQLSAGPRDTHDLLRSAVPSLTEMPRHASRLARQLERGELTVGTRLFPTEEDRRFVRSLVTAVNFTVMGTAAAVTGTLLLSQSPGRISSSYYIGVGGLFVGLLFMLRVISRGLRHGD